MIYINIHYPYIYIYTHILKKIILTIFSGPCHSQFERERWFMKAVFWVDILPNCTVGTELSCHNTVNFLKITHNNHCMAHPPEWDIGYPSWVQNMMYVLPFLLHYLLLQRTMLKWDPTNCFFVLFFLCNVQIVFIHSETRKYRIHIFLINFTFYLCPTHFQRCNMVQGIYAI